MLYVCRALFLICFDHQRDEVVGVAVVPEVDDEGLVLIGPAFELAVYFFGRFVDVEVAVLVGIDFAAVVFGREYHSVFVWLHFRNFGLDRFLRVCRLRRVCRFGWVCRILDLL